VTYETTLSSTRPDATALRGLCGGAVHLPGDPGYDAARVPWNVAVDQRPAAVAYPADASEVAALVKAAAAAGLRVAVQGTGHGAASLARLDSAVLLRMSGMMGVRVDPAARRARVNAGSLWMDVVQEAAPHGLIPLHGSSPDVGVVGYSLGGGLGWYARSLGLQANSVTAAELVTADGSLVRADADHEPDLFWALRGGGGNFGAVTALEFDLYPIRDAYAGLLAWDWRHAERVLARWAPWALTAPDAVTTSFRLLQLPPLPVLPEPLRGRQLVVVNGAVRGDDAEAERILAPLRELRPELDTFARVPAPSLIRLHMDPEGPTPALSRTALIGEMPPAAQRALLDAAGPDSGSSLLIAAEIRQLGGAVARPHPGGGALPLIEDPFLLFTCGVPGTPETTRQTVADTDRVADAMRPYGTGRQYLNFVECPTDASVAYSAPAWERLRTVRVAVDPHGLFVANHPVPAGS
jgi:FAD/FMN-containing dehydrogenase